VFDEEDVHKRSKELQKKLEDFKKNDMPKFDSELRKKLDVIQ